MTYHERLSALDASFIELEDVNVHMHVAAVLLFEPGPFSTPGGGVDVARMRTYLASRLHLVPRYRQRLAWIPLERHPVWVDDARFNIFYHVRHMALPRPGEERQLKRLCGRIFSQKLDVTKPLWELWVVEGLADGGFAIVAKVHHCMVDGIAGVELLQALLSPTPDAVIEPLPPWQPRPVPGPAELLAAAAWRRCLAPVHLAQGVGTAIRDPRRAVAAARAAAGGLGEVLATAGTSASATPLNAPIGPHRRFDWLRVRLDDAKFIRSRLGGTVNDVVLATVAGALRRFFHGRGTPADQPDFRALIPVNVRTGADGGTLGNRVAQIVARLPLGEPDRERRYARVVATTRELKQSHQVRGAELIEELGEWTATSVITETWALAGQRRAYNLIVTNVPGPQVDLYLLGAPLRQSYAMIPLFPNQALAIALFSYAGELFWGLNADWDLVPDLHDVVAALDAEFQALLALARHEGVHAA